MTTTIVLFVTACVVIGLVFLLVWLVDAIRSEEVDHDLSRVDELFVGLPAVPPDGRSSAETDTTPGGAMDTTHPQTVDDVVEVLKDQHTRLKKMLPTVIETSGTERAEAFTEVRHVLAVHEALEQSVIHPHAKTDAGVQEVTERMAEEHQATDVITRLEGLDFDSQEFHDTYAEFMLDVIAHAEHEEHEEFDEIEHQFSEEELARIAQAVSLLDAPPESRGMDFEQMLERATEQLAHASA